MFAQRLTDKELAMSKEEIKTFVEARAKELADLQYRIESLSKLKGAEVRELEELWKEVKSLPDEDVLLLYIQEMQEVKFAMLCTMWGSPTMGIEKRELLEAELRRRFEKKLYGLKFEDFKDKLPKSMEMFSDEQIERLSPFSKKNKPPCDDYSWIGNKLLI